MSNTSSKEAQRAELHKAIWGMATRKSEPRTAIDSIAANLADEEE